MSLYIKATVPMTETCWLKESNTVSSIHFNALLINYKMHLHMMPCIVDRARALWKKMRILPIFSHLIEKGDVEFKMYDIACVKITTAKLLFHSLGELTWHDNCN